MGYQAWHVRSRCGQRQKHKRAGAAHGIAPGGRLLCASACKGHTVLEYVLLITFVILAVISAGRAWFTTVDQMVHDEGNIVAASSDRMMQKGGFGFGF